MPKPIGNQVANLKSNDKVSHRTQAKFSSQAQLNAILHTPAPKAAPAKPKYKTRKK